MQTIQASDLAMNFLQILQSLKNGQSYVVETGQHEKIALLMPYDKQTLMREGMPNEMPKERVFGIGKDKGGFKIHDDFAMTEEELLGYE